jgi:radical SAM protein (TIGR01212 family)
MERLYRSYAQHLRETYGQAVYRIGVDAHFSCPNRQDDGRAGCAFCDGTGSASTYLRQQESRFRHDSAYQQEVSSHVNREPLELAQRIALVQKQVSRGKQFIHSRYHSQLYSLYFQAYTNTYDRIDVLKALYDAGLEQGPFVELIVSTRSDCIDDEVVALLASYQNRVRRVWVELGLQTADEKTLALVGRNEGVKQYISAVNSLHSAGIGVCTHVILGLPGEEKDAYMQTAQLVNQVHSEAVKIHNLHICGGTRLEGWYRQGEVSVASMRRHVQQSILFLRCLNPSIVIERMMCETPSHRLVSPRHFADKHQFLEAVREEMHEKGYRQGDRYAR